MQLATNEEIEYSGSIVNCLRQSAPRLLARTCFCM